jgi:hypothetical protein
VPVGLETMAPMAYAVVSGHRKPIVATKRCENAIALIDARQGEANRAYRVFFCPFKIRRTATIVFQFRVVAGTPYSLSIWPRYPIVFM